FPDGMLALRIFEPRYLDMVRWCLRSEECFGVLAIVSGSEAGPAKTHTVGTLAEIVDWHQGEDGLLGITAIGRSRFEASDITTRADGLYVGQARRLEPEPSVPLPATHAELARMLKRVRPALPAGPGAGERYEDATWVGYRLAEILPLSLEDRQACLEMEDALARL